MQPHFAAEVKAGPYRSRLRHKSGSKILGAPKLRDRRPGAFGRHLKSLNRSMLFAAPAHQPNEN